MLSFLSLSHFLTITIYPNCPYLQNRPNPVVQYLGKDSTSVPLMGTATRVYPVNSISNELWRLVPKAALGRPEAGETRYFAYHHCKTLTIRGTTIQKSICGGRFCDRQNSLDHTIAGTLSCGCFQAKSRHRFVMQHDIQIPCKNEIDDRLYVVIPNFRSYRFDTLIFREGCLQYFTSLDGGERACNKVLRQHVEDLVQHINTHHGWTIIGWVRTGRVHDTSEEGNRDAEDIAAEALNPHVTYLYPSCPDDMDESKHEICKNLRISESQLRTKVEQVREQRAAMAEAARLELEEEEQETGTGNPSAQNEETQQAQIEEKATTPSVVEKNGNSNSRTPKRSSNANKNKTRNRKAK